MRRPLGFRLALLGLVLGLVCVPAAAAKPSPTAIHPLADSPPQFRALLRERANPGHAKTPFYPSFDLKTAGGYQLQVLGIADAVVVLVEAGDGSAETGYVARGTVTPGRLEASFGKFGTIAMRFRPSRNRARPGVGTRCRGGARRVDRGGVYRGRFHFTGEDGYIAVRAHRAKGEVRTLEPCRRRLRRGPARREVRSFLPARGGPGVPPSALIASWRQAVESASFVAFSLGDRTHFFALTEESLGRLAILRFASQSGAEKALRVNGEVTQARVSAPEPFAGSGVYRAAPDGSTTWTGSLSVDFPGAKNYPLTGLPFEASVDAGF